MLDTILRNLPRSEHPDLLVGVNTADDAGVFRLTDDVALIQTVDFFTPIVDDPYVYGQISAANALSDVYAMGGRPLTVLNILAIPGDEIDAEMAGEILRGGQDKVAEAGAVVVGGHSVDDREPKYGLSVTGTVHPDQIVTNSGARAGDRLVLTKPLGTGLMADAYMDDALSEEALRPAVASMIELNQAASEAMVAEGAHACTDITGFGLMGHGRELAAASGVGLRIRASSVPAIPAALEVAALRQGGGLRRNRLAFEPFTDIADDVSESLRRVLFDPQTSGGLLISIADEKADALLDGLRDRQAPAWEIGEVLAGHPGRVDVRA